jgi:hypothetical protein
MSDVFSTLLEWMSCHLFVRKARVVLCFCPFWHSDEIMSMLP